MKAIKIFGFFILVLLLNGCVETIESFDLPSTNTTRVRYGYSDFDTIARRYATGNHYEILQFPLTNQLGSSEMHIRISDELNNNFDLIIDVITEDREAPIIEFGPSSNFVIEVFSPFIDQGITFKDNFDADRVIPYSVLQNLGYTSGIVDTSKTGVYRVDYQAQDSSGNLSNKITRVINVVDRTRPSISGTSKVTLVTGMQITDYEITYSDNYDSFDDIDISIDWNGLDANNPQPGIYIVTFTATDSSGNARMFERQYEILFDADSLEDSLTTLVNRGDYTSVFSSLENYRDTLGDDEINRLKTTFEEIISTRVTNEYNRLKDQWDTITRIDFLVENKVFLRNSFVNRELEQLILNEFNVLLDKNQFDAVLSFMQENEDNLTGSTYRSKIATVFSRMASATTPNNEAFHRSLLESYYIEMYDDSINVSNFKFNPSTQRHYVYIEGNKSTIANSYREIDYSENNFSLPMLEDPIGSNDLVEGQHNDDIRNLIIGLPPEVLRYSETMVIKMLPSRIEVRDYNPYNFLEQRVRLGHITRAVATPIVVNAIQQQMLLTYSTYSDNEGNTYRIYDFNQLIQLINVPYNHDREESLRAFAARTANLD